VDDAIDVYRRAGDETTLLSPARAGEPSRDVTFVDASEDGAIAYLQTEERLTADDTNARTDGYRVRSAVPPPAPVPIPDGAPPAGAVTEQPPAGTETAPERPEADGLRLLSRPRVLRLASRVDTDRAPRQRHPADASPRGHS
jgi:hypothetical protein